MFNLLHKQEQIYKKVIHSQVIVLSTSPKIFSHQISYIQVRDNYFTAQAEDMKMMVEYGRIYLNASNYVRMLVSHYITGVQQSSVSCWWNLLALILHHSRLLKQRMLLVSTFTDCLPHLAH